MKPRNKTAKPKLIAALFYNRPILAVFLLVFGGFGLVYIFQSFAGGELPTFTTNVEYWRPRIAGCESGNGPSGQANYKAVNASGHYGAYQFDIDTWQSSVSVETAAAYPLPTDAPPVVQDEAFRTAFSKRGTSPWNASYFCWAVDADPKSGQNISGGPQAYTYNITVSGRVTADGNGLANVTLNTCNNNPSVQTDGSGRFTLILPTDTRFCVRIGSGLPPRLTLIRTNNNPEHAKAKSYENQIAGTDCYRNILCLFGPSYRWDRNSDSSYNFVFTKQPQ